jgi:hypothetical protein
MTCQRCEGTGDLYGRIAGPIAICKDCNGTGVTAATFCGHPSGEVMFGRCSACGAQRHTARGDPMNCAVTVYDAIPPRPNARGRGETTLHAHACGEPLVRYGLCAHHASEKERLT